MSATAAAMHALLDRAEAAMARPHLPVPRRAGLVRVAPNYYAGDVTDDGGLSAVLYETADGERVFEVERQDGSQIVGEWDTSIGAEEWGSPCLVHFEETEGQLTAEDHDALGRAVASVGAFGVDAFQRRCF